MIYKYSRKEIVKKFNNLVAVGAVSDDIFIKYVLAKQDKPVECVSKEKPSTGKHLDKLVVPEKLKTLKIMSYDSIEFSIAMQNRNKINEVIDYLISLQKEK